ncbi:MAG TPA: lamin tail domain-containing protein [Polyangiaceae bacterium]|nr:lamin tail domain-containing protein [Polyangiaceae bacterium]
MSIRSLLLLSALAQSFACGDLPMAPVGQLQLGLSSGIGERHYRLTQATFAIEGAAQLTLESDDDPANDVVQRSLPEGSYSVRLLDGWQLERSSGFGSDPVAAELSSGNPLPFTIAAGELTTVTFQFRTLGDEGGGGAGGDGDVRIAIEVDGESTPHVIVSELMKNPEALPDADGEWIELYNAGSAAFDLDGCTLARDDQELPLEGPLVLEPGGALTLSNGEAPGFTPDVLYSGLTLPNSGAFVMRLACGGTTLDEVTLDPATWRAGRSLSLSGSALNDAANDDPARWCEAATSYNGDYGTPGEANPDCGS